MTAHDDITITLQAIEHEMRQMLEDQIKPYDAGRKIWKASMTQVAHLPDIMHPLWLIWGSLTDWVENHPDQEQKVEVEMRRAAREWLTLTPEDGAARNAYFDRWVYEELGYKRKGV